METVLVVAERTRGDEIKKLLYPGGYAFIRAESEREARMKILDYQLSLVIVDAMLPGSSAKDISIFAASQEVDTVLLLPEELFGHVAGMMMKYGVYTALFSRDSIIAVSSAISVAREKIRSAEEKNRKLLMRLRNEKLLTEAKCLLAGKKGMNEAEAHIYIEKKAMNCRISLLDAAMSIVRELS